MVNINVDTHQLIMNYQSLNTRSQEMKANLGVLYLAFKPNRTPWYAKALICLVVSYALSPIHLIPDFIPIFGYLDDLILVPLGIALAVNLIPDNVILESRENRCKQPASNISGIYAGLVIIAIWVILISLIIKP